jgi:hypothetical protein
MVPKINPMSITMPIALLVPSSKPPTCANIGTIRIEPAIVEKFIRIRIDTS